MGSTLAQAWIFFRALHIKSVITAMIIYIYALHSTCRAYLGRIHLLRADHKITPLLKHIL